MTVDGASYGHDLIITLTGKVRKRKKKLSKEVYGTSHTISLAEMEHVYQEGAQGIIIGSGQYGAARLSGEAREFLEKKQCRILLKPTSEAMLEWNRARGPWIGLFHITC